MPEDDPTLNEAEVPESGAQEEAPPADSQESPADYQQRYDDLRPQYDRVQNELQTYQQVFSDPTLLAQAAQMAGITPEALLEAFGYEAGPEDEEEFDFEDEEDPNAGRLEQIEQYLQEQSAAQMEAANQEMEDELVDRDFDEVEKEIGRVLTGREEVAVYALAKQMPDDDGVPDVKGAWEFLSGLSEEQRASYLKTKRAPSVEGGQAGLEKIDWGDKTSRIKALVSEANALDESE